MQAKVSPASESETSSNPNLGDREVQNQPNQTFSNQPNQALPNQPNQTLPNQPNQTFSNQQNQVNANPNQIASEKPVNNTIAQNQTSNTQNSGIKEGQFVHKGFNNQVAVELVKVKRIQNPESQQTGNTVAVKLRVKRLVENVKGDIHFYYSKARNLDTYEEYSAISSKSTETTSISSLPLNAWAEAYFWLEVPQGVKAIDIVFPETEVFRNVPIEG
jgi:aconitase B